MMDIWIIKVECVSGRYFEETSAKICEIQSSFDLESLCYFILDTFDFDDDHLHEFFISRGVTQRGRISIDDESTTLNDIFPIEKKNQLFMNFDFGDDWVFKITRSRKKVVFKENISYPRIIEQMGKNPEQYPMCEEYE